MMALMFGSPSSTGSDRSRQSHPPSNEAVAELVRTVAQRRKRSAVLLALTGQLLADTRELLERCATALDRNRYPGRRRPRRAAVMSRKPPREGPRR